MYSRLTREFHTPILSAMSEPDFQDTQPLGMAPAHLELPLRDLDAWTRYFRDAEIPVLSSTAQAIETMRADEDNVDAAALGQVIESDPLMTLKLLASVAGMRRSGTATETENVTTSIVMMGISPFFRNFGPQPVVERWLCDQPLALLGLQRLLLRAERAARFAQGFAVHRGDTDVGAIRVAVFLYDFAELLMWCHAPTLQLQIAQAQREDPNLRSAGVQRSVLNIEFDDLRQNLMRLWRLPELLVRISDNRHAELPIVRNVVLAVRLARHTMHGWNNPAIPDDVEDISQLLNSVPRVTLAFLRKIDQPAD